MALGNNQLAIYQARILLEKVGFADTPINPWKIVTLLKEQGLPFELFEESSGSIEGCTMKNNGKVSIILNKDIKSLTRRKFTLAHELGHAWLRSHTGKFSCESATIETRTKNERESEANAFAAELLMPEDNFLSDIRNLNPTVDALHELGDVKYGTSITSTALRFAELTTIPCAVVLSEKGVVKWVRPSSTWEGFIQERALDSRSIAARCHKGGNANPSAVETPANVWLDSARPGKNLLEECMAIPSFNQVITILQPADDF